MYKRQNDVTEFITMEKNACKWIKLTTNYLIKYSKYTNT